MGLPLVSIMIINLAHPASAEVAVDYLIFSAPASFSGASLGLAPSLPAYSDSITILVTNVTTLQVEECIPGYYSYDDAQTCTACGAGKYSTAYTATTEMTCVACESGKYSSSLAASNSQFCLDCPVNTYFDGTSGQSVNACTACPGNSSSYAGSRLLQACVCDGGFMGPNGGPCAACNASVWCLNGQANPCPTNSKSQPLSSSLAACLCLPGFYGDTTIGGPELTLCQVSHARNRG